MNSHPIHKRDTQLAVVRTGDRSAPGLAKPAKPWRVLVVEKNSSETECLASALRRLGHDVHVVETGSAAFQVYDDHDFVLLDFQLPDLDGLEVCRAIRSASDVPLIAVAAREAELDCVLGLQAGADDFVVRPYVLREMLARMDAVMRRTRPLPENAKVVECGPLRIDASIREVHLRERNLNLTRKEFDLLYLLASNHGTVIPRKRIIQQVWGDSWSRRTVDTHVSNLRNKLGASTWIVTVRGVGFRFGSGA
jgi:DNA-binding response OmpR family regulator